MRTEKKNNEGGKLRNQDVNFFLVKSSVTGDRTLPNLQIENSLLQSMFLLFQASQLYLCMVMSMFLPFVVIQKIKWKVRCLSQ